MNDSVPLPSSGAAHGQTVSGGLFSPGSLFVYFVAAIPTLIKLLCYPAYPGSDDAYIHLTMVRNLTHALGWGINPHEPVYLASSPLYTLMVAGLSLCGVPALAAGEILSALAGFFALIVLHRLLTRLGLRPLSCLAGVIVASFNIYLWRWNGVVMETTTGLFFLTLACWVYHGADPLATDRPSPAWRYVLTGVIVGLATLTRFELSLILGCFGLCEMANRRPSRFVPSCLLLSLGFFLVMVPWLAFCHAYFHALLPTTFYKKTSSGLILWNPSVVTSLFKLIIGGDALPLLGLAGLWAVVWTRGLRVGFVPAVRSRLDLFLFPLLLALFYYLKTANLESAARYYLPGLHLLVVVMACGFDALSREVSIARLRPVVWGVLAAHVVSALAINQLMVAPILSRFPDNYLAVARDAAGYLRQQSANRHINVLVEVDIGMLSYFTENACYLTDGGALATPSLRGKSIAQQVAESHPDLVIETLGERVGGLTDEVPSLRLVWHRQFLSHSLSRPKTDFITNIYENTKR